MKQAILFAVIITVTHPSFARTVPVNHHINSRAGIYTDTLTATSSSMQDMLTAIMNVTGLQADFELKEAQVPNIEASISHKKRYILYNPAFISWINRATHDKWGAIALLAHEVGHHLNGHTIMKGGSRPDLELEADEFAGFVLYRLGASLAQSQEVMKYIANTQSSLTHPARASRMEAIQKGWDKAAKS